MNDLAMWTLLVGFISATFVLPVIQQPAWTEKTRSAVTFTYSIVVGLGTAFFSGHLDEVDWHNARVAASAVLMVLVSAVASYKGFAKPSGVAPGIEAATAVGTTERP